MRLTLLSLLTLTLSNLSAQNSDDFASFFTEENTNYTQDITTTAGWHIVNCCIKNIGDETLAPTLSGKADSPGTITSPEISGGISELSFHYMCYYSDKVADVTINILQDGKVVDTYRLYNDAVVQKEEYDYAVSEIDLEGDFVIEFVNNSPSGKDDRYTIDRVSIWDITWKSYPEPSPELTPEYNAIQKDYNYGDKIEFDNPEGVHILYSFNTKPDYENIYSGPEWTTPEEAEYEDGVTYDHSTHPLFYLGKPISAQYVAYEPGKLPSEVNTLDYTTTAILDITVLSDSPATYSDLFGRKVSEPIHGNIYITFKDGSATKIRY